MNALEELKKSDAWDFRYEAPTFPRYNNPHIYAALVHKVLNQNGFIYPSYKFTWACFEPKTGFFSRWPNGDGGQFSHDECIGAAYISEQAAQRIYEKIWLPYNNEQSSFHPRQLLFRITHALAFVQKRATGSVWFPLQVAYAAFVFLVTKQNDGAKGHIQVWLTSEYMREHWVCRKALEFWDKRHPPMSDMLRLEPRSEWLAKYVRD